jgi:hypothetical protein
MNDLSVFLKGEGKRRTYLIYQKCILAKFAAG